MINARQSAVLAAALLLAGCAAPGGPPPGATVPAAPTPQPCPPCPACPPVAEKPPPRAPYLRPAAWDDLPGWRDDAVATAWEPFLRSCSVLARREPWAPACQAAAALSARDAASLRAFFESRFTPWQVFNGDGAAEGLVTGYYEPLLRGSRSPGPRYRYPIYGVPDDLLVVDLAAVYPELKGMRLRGRIQGNKVVPYFSRAEIEEGAAPVRGRELLWVEDPVELFFLQIQGSGQVQLDSGQTVRVGYADQNGYPYRSLGRYLVERGELALEKASMQGIKAWAQRNPAKLREALDYNASYVFFRELPGDLPGPPGALGVPLAAGRSIAVDPRAVPLGAPVFLATTEPDSAVPLARLVMAQDTGGAIKGGVRADFFWGSGAEAGEQAGRMKQPGRMWVLYPQGHTPLPDH